MMRLIALALLATAAGAFDVPSLNPDNYDELTEGKTVFLKFFSPGVRSLEAMSCVQASNVFVTPAHILLPRIRM
jgi:hypothetical protein